MKWSFKVGEIFGISIRVHAIFLLLLLIIGLSEASTSGVRAGLISMLFVASVFVCVLLHELGHSVQAKRYGIKVEDITLLPIGGVAHMHEIPENPRKEIRITLAGLVVSFAIAGVIFLILLGAGRISELRSPTLSGIHFLANLFWANVILGFFNVIPAFPMDGGRVFRALLAQRLDYVRATHIAAMIGQGLAMLFALVGIFFGNWLLIVVALFIFMGAGSEEHMVQMRSFLREVPARTIMATDLYPLSPGDPLSKAIECVYRGCYSDFPVADNGRLMGILTKTRLITALHERGLEAKVSDVMDTDLKPVRPDEPLAEVHQKMVESGVTAMPVVDEGHIVGMISLENIGRFFMVSSALKKGAA
jgi:stage IV sporulation protein FB